MLQATRGCEDNIDANLNVDLSLVIVETSELHGHPGPQMEKI